MNLVPECSVKSASADLENLSAFRHPAAALHRGCFTQLGRNRANRCPRPLQWHSQCTAVGIHYGGL